MVKFLKPITFIKFYLSCLALLIASIYLLSPSIISFFKPALLKPLGWLGLANLQAVFILVFNFLGISIFVCGLYLLISAIFLAVNNKQLHIKRIIFGLALLLLGLTDPFSALPNLLISMLR